MQAFVPVRASARVTKCACEVVISKGKGTCQTHSSSGSQAACCCRLVQKCEPAANLLRLQASGPQVRARPPGAAEAARSGRGSAHSSIIWAAGVLREGGVVRTALIRLFCIPLRPSGHTRLRPQSDFSGSSAQVCGDRPARVCWSENSTTHPHHPCTLSYPPVIVQAAGFCWRARASVGERERVCGGDTCILSFWCCESSH